MKQELKLKSEDLQFLIDSNPKAKKLFDLIVGKISNKCKDELAKIDVEYVAEDDGYVSVTDKDAQIEFADYLGQSLVISRFVGKRCLDTNVYEKICIETTEVDKLEEDYDKENYQMQIDIFKALKKGLKVDEDAEISFIGSCAYFNKTTNENAVAISYIVVNNGTESILYMPEFSIPIEEVNNIEDGEYDTLSKEEFVKKFASFFVKMHETTLANYTHTV